MLERTFCFLVLLINFSCSLSYDIGENVEINIERNQHNISDLVYIQNFDAPSKSLTKFHLKGLNHSYLSYTVFQLHSYHMNVSLSPDKTFGGLTQKDGTNLGLIIKNDNYSKTLYLWNNNYDDVKCLVAVIVYNHSAPVPGGCSSGTPLLELGEEHPFITLHTPRGKSSYEMSRRNQTDCSFNSTEMVTYLTYFIYLEQMNFSHELYFDGIKNLMFRGIETNGYQAKKVYSPLKQYFEKTEGTGLVVNTVIIDGNGQHAYYIPSVTYSCPSNTWKDHCTDRNPLKRSFDIALVIYSVVMILNLVIPELVESCMNGMLFGSLITLAMIKNRYLAMTNFNIFMATVLGALIGSAIFGTISLFLRVGRYLTKLTFSTLVMAFVMEIFFDHITSVYCQFAAAIVMSIGFYFIKISFAVLHGGLLLIMGLSHLLKIGNIHRIVINNFHVLTSLYTYTLSTEDNSLWNFTRINFINYKVHFELFDYALITFFIFGSIFFTIRKEIYFLENADDVDSENLFSGDINRYNRTLARKRRENCWVGIRRSSSTGRLTIVSRCRRRHHFRSNVIHERSPLISHWLESDETVDEVFESPNSNSRFMQALDSESKERVDAIQKFEG